ncbi:MAG: MoaD/ThiS family protein [Desulfocucumaceae bacterium]
MINVTVEMNLPWLPRKTVRLTLAQGSTITALLETLGIDRQMARHITTAVNGRIRLAEDPLSEGDRVLVLPILCGG